MPASQFRTTDFQLRIKRARRRRDDLAVAGKPPQFLAFSYQDFVGERVDKFAVFLCIKILESNWTVQENTREWSVEEGTKILTRRLRYHS